MIERQIDIPVGDGRMATFVCHPERNGPFPAIIFYMDALGIREELRDMARRLATCGYYVMLPNLYYREGVIDVGPMPAPDDAETIARITGYIHSLTVQKVMDDTEAMLRFAGDDTSARAGPAGCVGYCMSGQFAVNAAARYPDRIAACASIYGTWLMSDKPDSPHLAARRAKAELYFACAETDHWVPLDVAEALKKDLAAAKVDAEVELYWGVEHGFAFPERDAYDKGAAERHWERLLALFRRKLI